VVVVVVVVVVDLFQAAGQILCSILNFSYTEYQHAIRKEHV